MARPTAHLYRFDRYCLDATTRVLMEDGDPVPLTPKAFDTLLVLVSRSGRVVRKEELLNAVWPDTFVEESTLAQNVFTLRKALGRGRNKSFYIETVPKHGYRFNAEVSELRGESASLVVERLTRTHVISEELDEGTEGNANAYSFRSDKNPLLAELHGQAKPEVVRQAVAAPALVIQVRRYWRVGATVLLLFLAVATGLFMRFARPSPGRNSGVAGFQAVKFTKLTNTGNVMLAAISPDGKYCAYVQNDGLNQSLWLRQVSAINSIQVVPSHPVNYFGLSFALDSSALYYGVYDQETHVGAIYVGALYEIPVLGGVPRKIVSDIDSNISFSPDGKRFAFVRLDPTEGNSTLILANIDGTSEQILSAQSKPSVFVGQGIAWSPDGKLIACALRMGESNHRNVALVGVQVQTGKQESLSSQQWSSIGQVAWRSDGTGLVFDGWDESLSSLSTQIWEISHPGGEARVIVNDLNRYQGLSITADAKTLLTISSSRVASLWIASTEDIGKARQIASANGDRYGEKEGIAWTSDGHIVYGSTADDKISVWIMNSDGSNQKQLTAEPHINFKPTVSPDGRSIVFVSRRTGSPHLWKMDIDGNNLKQLTNGNTETLPDVTPDGRFIVYTSLDNNKPTVWKVAIDGGEPILLTDAVASYPTVSPDGKLIACYYRETPTSYMKIAIIPSGGGRPIKTLDISLNAFPDAGIRWSHRGDNLTYIDNKDGVSNIWSQPIAGGAPKKLTNFSSQKIFRFAFAGDGKQLVYERGFDVNDLVLLRSAE